MKFSSQMKILIFVVLICLASTPGIATPRCPTVDDLKTGVTFTRSSPLFSELVVQTGRGIKVHRIMTSKGETTEIVSSYTHPIAVEERRSSSGVLSITYSTNPLELANLDKLENWASDIKFFQNSELFSEGEFEVELIDTSSVTIENCTFSTWTVETTLIFDKGGAPIRYRKEYAPDLNWVLKNIRLARSGIPISQVSYDKITIGQLR